MKLDTSCRIGEIMNFKVSDYSRTEKGRQFTIRQAKGRQPRGLPVSSSCANAIDEWLKVRKRVMSEVPKSEDEGWLFMSETGGRGNEGNYLRGLKKIIRWAGLPEEMNNHSQRRFSAPLIRQFHSRCEARLVRTFVALREVVLCFRNRADGLLLSELGGYLLGPHHAPAGTRRLSNPLRRPPVECPYARSLPLESRPGPQCGLSMDRSLVQSLKPTHDLCPRSVKPDHGVHVCVADPDWPFDLRSQLPKELH